MMRPELLIPAGNLSKLRTALAYGADAVYVGLEGLSMRPDKASFSKADLSVAVGLTHNMGKRIYVAINTMMFPEDLPVIREWLTGTENLPVDAVIVSDAGAFSLVRELRPNLAIHISTQMSVANAEAARFWKHAGASRIVLARECSLAQASEIAHRGEVEVELFVHGAMCAAISGRCLLSAFMCGQSGSKGLCKHACRWEWELVEKKRPGQAYPVFETKRGTIFLGSTDLCLIAHIPELVKTAATALKVEGRMKGEYYLATVTRVYRDALDCYFEDPLNFQVKPEWIRELEAVSHRPYDTGFAFGYPVDAPQSLQAAGPTIRSSDPVAVVESISGNRHRVSVKTPFRTGEDIEWIGPAMAGGKVRISGIYDAGGNPINRAQPGTVASVTTTHAGILPENAILRRPHGKDVPVNVEKKKPTIAGTTGSPC